MTYLSPLAYLLGLEGVALLRSMREGSAHRQFVEDRIAEIRALLDTPALAEADGVTATPTHTAAELYRSWAPRYDDPGNGLIDLEQPIVHGILDGLPVGTALDAACDTGRHAAYLAGLGHQVIGVDESPEMLAEARKRLPEADWREADLRRIPLPDDAVDTVVCGLALSHVPDLEPVLAEFARVLRPGGHLVISDLHVLRSYLRPTLVRAAGADGGASILTEYHRPLSDYLAAALPLGFQVRHCEEPSGPPRSDIWEPAPDPLPTQVSWELLHWCREAAAAAFDGCPSLVIWLFQLESAPSGYGG